MKPVPSTAELWARKQRRDRWKTRLAITLALILGTVWALVVAHWVVG